MSAVRERLSGGEHLVGDHLYAVIRSLYLLFKQNFWWIICAIWTRLQKSSWLQTTHKLSHSQCSSSTNQGVRKLPLGGHLRKSLFTINGNHQRKWTIMKISVSLSSLTATKFDVVHTVPSCYFTTRHDFKNCVLALSFQKLLWDPLEICSLYGTKNKTLRY